MALLGIDARPCEVEVDVTGIGYEPVGEVRAHGGAILDAAMRREVELVLGRHETPLRDGGPLIDDIAGGGAVALARRRRVPVTVDSRFDLLRVDRMPHGSYEDLAQAFPAAVDGDDFAARGHCVKHVSDAGVALEDGGVDLRLEVAHAKAHFPAPPLPAGAAPRP